MSAYLKNFWYWNQIFLPLWMWIRCSNVTFHYLIYLLTYSLTHWLNYFLPTYLLLTYLLTCQPTYLITHSLTHSLTPWSRVLPEKLSGLQLVKKFSAFYGTRRFITAFTSTRHLSLFWASSIQSVPPHPTSWRPILILPSHLLGLPSSLFPLGFLTKILCMPLFSPIHSTCLAHLILLDFITQTNWVRSTDH